MGREPHLAPPRTYRLLLLALGVLFAGVVALPVKLTASRGLRVVASAPASPPALALAAPAPPPTSTPPPAPAPVERPIQAPDEPAVPDAPGAFAVGGDGAATLDALALPPPPERPPVEQGAVTPYSIKVYGVVIGINDYPGDGADLRGAVADATDMTDAMAMYGVPESNVTELVDATATANNIVTALRWLVANTAPDSTAVVFYAGHVRKLSDQTEAIVASDGTVIPDWFLARQLSSLPAKKVWIVMATCYGGGFTELLAPGRVLTAAADANSIAYENASFGRSYLDEFLVHQALLEHGAPVPTAQSAFAYAQSRLQQQYPNRTLTQFDESTEQISLDGVPRATEQSTAPGGGQPQPPSGPLPQPGSPPATPSPAPQPCRNLLGLFCPPGSR